MSIKEIAALAGVSKSTVSRYLNNGYVSEAAKIKIKKVIEETGFVPSEAAVTLRTKVTKRIGVIIPKLNSDAVSKMVSGITEVLNRENYYTLIANVDNNENEEIKYLSVFDEKTVDGIILIGSVFTKNHDKALKNINVPIVILAQHYPNIPSVYFDNVNASKEAAKLAIYKHKYPAMISARLDDVSTGKERQDGYFKALDEAGLKSIGIEYSKFTIEDGYQACKRLMEANPIIDAIFCSSDHMAIGALNYLRDINKKIPEEVSISSVGGSTVCKTSYPNLTTANLEYYNSGKKSADILLDIINNKDSTISSYLSGFVLSKTNSVL